MSKSLIFHVRRQYVGCMIFVFHNWVAFKLSVSLAIALTCKQIQTLQNPAFKSLKIPTDAKATTAFTIIVCVCVIDKDSVPISIGSIFYNKHHRIKFFNSFFMYGR